MGKKMRLSFVISAGLALAAIVIPTQAQQIITNGMTNTTLSVNGTTTDVTTSTVVDGNAFNSFSKFNVDEGNTVNLRVPPAARNLINVVNSTSPCEINSTLNSIINGQTGGNVFLVNPMGIGVDAQGSINTGSLSIITPTQNFVNNFFTAANTPNPASVSALLAGTAPINPAASVTLNGPVNVMSNVVIRTGHIRLADNVIRLDPTVQPWDIVNLQCESLDIRGSTLNVDGDLRFGSSPRFNIDADADTKITLGGSFNRVVATMQVPSSWLSGWHWTTYLAQLDLTASPNSDNGHWVSVLGEDLGPGENNGFGWGTLILESGETMNLEDWDDKPGGALYLGVLNLEDGLSQLAGIESNGLNIYYDPTLPANDYLAGLRYDLTGGGAVIPIPEPATMSLLTLAGLGLAARRPKPARMTLSAAGAFKDGQPRRYF